MALIGKNNEEKIWNYCKAQGMTDAGTAGLMGNLYAESGLRPNNLQNSYEGKLGMADAEYTEMVDNGSYTNFGRDWAGYRTLQVNGRYIRGYCLPKYAGKAGAVSSAPAAAAPTASTVTVKKAAEAAKSFDKALAGTYTVTAGSGLHIRSGAGTTKASLTVLPKGTTVRSYGYYTLAGGVKWLYIQVTYQGIQYTGFSSSQYLRKQ